MMNLTAAEQYFHGYTTSTSSPTAFLSDYLSTMLSLSGHSRHHNQRSCKNTISINNKKSLMHFLLDSLRPEEVFSSIKCFLCNQMQLRKKWQKVEFLSCWILILLLHIMSSSSMSSSIVSSFSSSPAKEMMIRFLPLILVEQEYDQQHHHNFSHDILLLATCYDIQMSIITRFLAYVVDFANALKKIGSLPCWLILHHGGVLIVHILVGLFFVGGGQQQPQSKHHYYNTIICLLAMQSTHNTWTKKYSLALYWGNVLLGAVTSVVYVFRELKEGSFSWAFYVGMAVPVGFGMAGAALLFKESMMTTRKC